MRSLLAILLLLSITASVEAQGKKWALLVGVSKYENTDIGDLKYTVKDVDGLRSALIRNADFDEENVYVLTNEKKGADRATDTNVLRRLESLAGKVTGQDTFFFYFSGHGFTNNGKHFLATVNTDITDLRSLERSSISVDDLKAKLGRIRAKQCVFIFDACRNSPMGKGASDQQLSAGLARDLKMTASSAQVPVVFLMSCKEGQKSFEYDDKEQGAFTWFLLEGLRGKAVDGAGLITMNGLGKFVQAKMKEWSADYLRGESQTPDFLQFGGAETVVLAKRKANVGGMVEVLKTDALLSVVTEPKGAKVLLNGKDTGKVTPVSFEVALKQTSEQAIVELELEGHKSIKLRVTLQLGMETPINQKFVRVGTTTQAVPVAGGASGKNAQGFQTKINPKDGAEMIFIPAGEFLMGDSDQGDNPRRKINVEGYWIYKYPVTVAQYKKYCDATGTLMPEPPGWGWELDHPIVNVSWNDCQKYCQWAGVRLPNEKEWEKAARGTMGLQFPWGNEFDPSKLYSSAGDVKVTTAPVVRGKLSAHSPYGLVDMAGNVWQWCQDEYRAGSGTKVLRGGSWYNANTDYLRISYRDNTPADNKVTIAGFRCASSR